TAMARSAADCSDRSSPVSLREAPAAAATAAGAEGGAPVATTPNHACGARTDESRIQALAHGYRRDGAAGTGLGAAGARRRRPGARRAGAVAAQHAPGRHPDLPVRLRRAHVRGLGLRG